MANYTNTILGLQWTYYEDQEVVEDQYASPRYGCSLLARREDAYENERRQMLRINAIHHARPADRDTMLATIADEFPGIAPQQTTVQVGD